MTADPYRLPRAVAPVRYDLQLEPDLGTATFEGTVAITLEVRETTDRLVCNAAELAVHEATVEIDDEAASLSPGVDEEHERLTFALARPVQPGAAVTLRLRFSGALNDKLRGWYRSTFSGEDGVEQVIATSQMQATDCRRAFPCWDEPDLKARFAVTIAVDDGLLAISNGAEVERHRRHDGKWVLRFAETIPMSTYLVAFVVGPLEATEPVDVDGVPMRIVHVPGKADLTAFGLEAGAFALRWFRQYYDLPYPGEKVDLVALPDFAAGAMENLGCITFREHLLLADPATCTRAEQELVVDVIAHELAHMWFGDLVTMRWWNGIWLNEAFATFMEVAATDAFRPEWKRWDSFSVERSAAFETDSLLTTRPVEYEVVSPADADGMFDVLTYEKGGALLRMLEQYLGEGRYRDGIRHYLRTHAYDNTETGDLWDAIEATTGEPVRRTMDSWIWQPGYPLVSAALAPDGSSVILRQERFLFGEEPDDTRWAIPVRLRQIVGDAAHESRLLLDGTEATVALVATDAAVVVNSGGHGFYRVAYDAVLRRRLGALVASELSTVERYDLVDDTWAAVVAGRLDAAAFCALAAEFSAERDVAVWRALTNGLAWCDRLLEGAPRERFRAFVRSLTAPALAELGWEPRPGDDDLTLELRGLLIRSLGVLGWDEATQAKAREVHEAQLVGPDGVDPSVAAAVVAVVAATGGDADHERFVTRFHEATTPQEQLRYLYALADFREPGLMARTLQLAMSDQVKTQNAPFLLARCIANRDLGEQAWRFVRQHWDDANRRFPDNSIVRMVDPVKTLVRPEQQADVAAFFAEHQIPQAAKTLQQVLERQRVNVALRERETAPLAEAFSE